ncbi:MAG: ribosomal protein S18-alanine N-acetyltransferase [Gemmatimonadaceae bacterium]
MRIRDAVEADLGAIVAIERASFSDPWTEKSFRAMLGHGTVQLRVAERGRSVLGYSVAWIVGDEAEIANLAVAAAERRQGIGAALLDDLLALVDREASSTVHLEVRAGNAAAQALYASRGFTACGRRKAYYAAPVEDAVIMKRHGRILR